MVGGEFVGDRLGCPSGLQQRALPRVHRRARLSGNPAIVGPEADRPEALRPRLSTGLPCFTVRITLRETQQWTSARRRLKAQPSHRFFISRGWAGAALDIK